MKQTIILVLLAISLIYATNYIPSRLIELTKAELEDSQLNLLAWRLAACESSQTPDIQILDSNNEYSFGMLQFQRSTFDYFGEKYKLPHDDILSYEQARDIFKAMYRDGIWQKHWVICAEKLTK